MWCSILWCFVAILCQVSCIEDYYWRSYTGSVPDDAFVAGKDISGKNVYVGRVYMKDGGLVPGSIYHGSKEIEITWGGPVRKDKYIDILCGSQENFHWLRTDKAHLHLDLLGKRPVLGGFYEGVGYYYIGRIFGEGQTVIGKILQFDLDDPHMTLVIRNSQKRKDSYEVLCYNDEEPPLYKPPKLLKN